MEILLRSRSASAGKTREQSLSSPVLENRMRNRERMAMMMPSLLRSRSVIKIFRPLPGMIEYLLAPFERAAARKKERSKYCLCKSM